MYSRSCDLIFSSCRHASCKTAAKREESTDKGAVSASSSSFTEMAKMDELILPWERQLSGLPLWEASGGLEPT